MKSLFIISLFAVFALSRWTGLAADFQRDVLPILTEYCNTCHSTDDPKGELDLERFTDVEEIQRHPEIWENVLGQIADGEMPPKGKPRPAPEQKELLVSWVRATLDEAALASAGDPGPVVLRRLSNAEYTYTIRDLTGVESLDPAREFPADGAAGEGFTNTGAALVMSPSLVTKYLDAAKEIAAHLVPLPDGIGFSPSVSPRDWTEERLAAIRAFYGRYTVPGGGSAVDLQGIRFNTEDGGVAPLEKYLAATLSERDALASGTRTVAEAAAAHGLNAKYFEALWETLKSDAPASSPLLDSLRARWREATPADAPALAEFTGAWQRTLWRFTQVGHIGKRGGPEAWQVPVNPLAESREVRAKLPPPGEDGAVTFYLSARVAGGTGQEPVVWKNPRLTAPGRPDLPLRDARAAFQTLVLWRKKMMENAAACLRAAAELTGPPREEVVAALAWRHGVELPVLTAWLKVLGMEGAGSGVDALISQKAEAVENYNFIQGWTGADALSVLANSSDQAVRIPGLVPPRGVVAHPSPSRRVAVGWRSPVAGHLRVEAVVRHAHPECGNGVEWSLQWRRGSVRRQLAAGISDGGNPVMAGPLENVSVRPGDLIVLSIGPRGGNHSCDLTALDLVLADGTNTWDLAGEVSSDILAGNPRADALGNPEVWHFFSEPDAGADAVPVIPSGSLLARWYDAEPEERSALAEELRVLLLAEAPELPEDSPDAALRRLLTPLNGPLCAAMPREGFAPDRSVPPGGEVSQWALDPALFGPRPDLPGVAETDLCVLAPSVVEVRLPAELARDYEFAATAAPRPEAGEECAAQMTVETARPSGDGRSLLPDSPVLARADSAAWKRFEAAFQEFRGLFPAALCYTKIVPVDEVVTLTLYYREDHELRRLMLNDEEAAELDRLWDELRYVSQDAIKLVDAFEQLWQYATQDSDPSAFTHLREPIRRRAGEFQARLLATQPAHLEGVLNFAEKAWRRPLSEDEKERLRALYRRLREQEEFEHEEALRLTLCRVLTAPAFLYRLEQAPPGTAAAPVNDWELATRLSYFLWSSAPDDELRGLAAAGTLSQPETLAAQAARMARDPKVRRLALEFGCQWLHVRDLDTLDEKSERHFPEFASLRADMREEIVRFFMDLFQENRSALSLLDADYTFVSGPLAKHYGFEEIDPGAGDWRRVEGAKAAGRGGILGFAGTLAKQSGASRTSPILRGNWLSEVVLGERLPKPPKGVPVLPEETLPGLTERQLIERHSSDPNCARCHARIDPFGFALEGFDAIGRRRTVDAAGLPVDTATVLPGGKAIEGLEGLRAYLLHERREDFLRQFCRKLLGYALGRAVRLSDRPLLDSMIETLKANDYKVHTALELIVLSPQFRQIRGRDFPTATTH